jgi:hypothetical protein
MTDNEKQPPKEDQRATDDIMQSARYQEIRKADLAKEQAIAEAHEATKLEAKKQSTK